MTGFTGWKLDAILFFLLMDQPKIVLVLNLKKPNFRQSICNRHPQS